MRYKQDDERVRPIPIDDGDPSLFRGEVLDRHTTSGTRHPWLPIVLSGLGVAIILGSVAGFGAIQDDEPPPAFANPTASDTAGGDTTTTTIFGLPLNETIPDIEDRLTLIVSSEDGPAALQWDPDFIRPKEIILNFRPAEASFHEASFDSGGRFIAVAEKLQDSRTYNLSLGIPTNLETGTLHGVQSHVWHATEVGRLAWIQQMADESSMLYTANVDPLTRSLMHISAVGPVSDAEELVRWDSQGFLLNDGAPSVVWRSNTDAALVRSEPGLVAAASATTMILAPIGVLPTHLTEADLATRSGDVIRTLFDKRVMEDEAAAHVAMSANTDLIVNFRGANGSAHLEVSGPTVRNTHHLTYRRDLTPIGFSTNDRFVVLRLDGTNDLVFVDWAAGTFHTLDIPDGYEVLAFDIG
ncbi:MAG: hypothetical protein M5U23_08185 [Acidimicrobiia bacterium]|nr:hypothetical protein [Acidimicrobiia bacterium]